MSTSVQNNVTLNAFREAFDSTERTIEQQKAFQEFCRLGLPSSKSEEYRFTPIGKFLEANFDLVLYGQNVVSTNEIETSTEEILVNIANGKLIIDEKSINASGIIVSIKETEARPTINDAFVALNYAFTNKEIHIQIPPHVSLNKTIRINHILDSETEQLMLNTRLIVELGKGSSCSIFETFESSGINPVFSNIKSEYRTQKDSLLNYYRLQNDAGTYQVNNSTVKQLGKSVVNSFIFTFDGTVIRNNSIFSIESEHCESNFYGLYFPSGKSLIDNHTVADHHMPNCTSNELYKGIIADQAKGVFNGKIFVRPDAQKTNAFQSNRNILLSDAAFINTKPQLEIWADDVKCSHGCTTGQLDKEALFYLRSRGISADDARTLLLSAFASEVINEIKDEKLRVKIDQIVTERLNSPY